MPNPWKSAASCPAIRTTFTAATSKPPCTDSPSAVCICRTATRRPVPKYDYKLKWLARLLTHAAALAASETPVILLGDYNVIPTERDVYKPERWVDDALFRVEVRETFATLLKQGWTDALRTLHPDETIYTFWDFFRNAYARDAGLRIDHLLLNAALLPRLTAAGVDRDVRGWENPATTPPSGLNCGADAVMT